MFQLLLGFSVSAVTVHEALIMYSISLYQLLQCFSCFAFECFSHGSASAVAVFQLFCSSVSTIICSVSMFQCSAVVVFQ